MSSAGWLAGGMLKLEMMYVRGPPLNVSKVLESLERARVKAVMAWRCLLHLAPLAVVGRPDPHISP